MRKMSIVKHARWVFLLHSRQLFWFSHIFMDQKYHYNSEVEECKKREVAIYFKNE